MFHTAVSAWTTSAHSSLKNHRSTCESQPLPGQYSEPGSCSAEHLIGNIFRLLTTADQTLMGVSQVAIIGFT